MTCCERNRRNGAATDELRRKAAEIVARPDYELQPQHENLDWLMDFLWEALLWVLTPFAWLFRLTEGLPMFVRWLIIIVLVVILALLVWHILYSLVQAVQAPRRRAQLEQEALRGRPDPAELDAGPKPQPLDPTTSPPCGCCSGPTCCTWRNSKTSRTGRARPIANCSGAISGTPAWPIRCAVSSI